MGVNEKKIFFLNELLLCKKKRIFFSVYNSFSFFCHFFLSFFFFLFLFANLLTGKSIKLVFQWKKKKETEETDELKFLTFALVFFLFYYALILVKLMDERQKKKRERWWRRRGGGRKVGRCLSGKKKTNFVKE